MNEETDRLIDHCFWKELENEFMFSELQQLDKMLENVSYYTSSNTFKEKDEKQRT